ncbi:hypothetical protein [Virgibacillus sp. L01]|uniref:hypothetical protein n=1 Tax=Virgibacillus sp. L01 TaxID=3457429 RepID=UPI003FD49583
MSFFVIQVQTNYEKNVQNTLTHILNQKQVNIVKSIYALDTNTLLGGQEVGSEGIKAYLQSQRLRSHLNNMRYAYANIDTKTQGDLKKEYRGFFIVCLLV